MNLPGYNPKKSELLDSLRLNSVELLAIPAEQYSTKANLWSLVRELENRYLSNPRVHSKEALNQEYLERSPDLIERAFGTRQKPLILSFGPDTYTAFVPNKMAAEEFENFKASIRSHELLLAKITANKNENGWSYSLN
ncbi:hypothetical protein IEN85_09125 [Pelagicoccus sp. NFK12]|uniref:Uncharacterized protein n=1 Tax=Pelagicoccus enzymogenes TaxID=2773457 RepID=A0A927IHN8_9BACT|nr:hypothetical protein [Pelagicoccus enzymogenes]MBD5779655.1 hypothetical protein [Pelagicoccus enzymogenes]